MFERQGEFSTLAIVSDNEKILCNKSEFLTDEEMKIVHSAAKKSKNDIDFIYLEERTVCIEKVILSGYKNAALVGEISPNIKEENYDSGIRNDLMFILNSNNKVVCLSGSACKNFDYNLIEKDWFYNKGSEFEQDIAQGSDLMEMMANQERENFTDFFSGEMFKVFADIANSNGAIWYEKPISLENGDEWKILINHPAEFSKASMNLVQSVALRLVTIMLIVTIIMIGFNISYGITSYKIIKLAYTDLSTGFANWNKFEVEVPKLFKKNKNFNYALVSLDIRKFRIICEMEGVIKSDDVLKILAAALKKEVGKRETFARFVSDEFALLLKYQSPDELNQRILEIDKNLKATPQLKNLDYNYGIFYIANRNVELIEPRRMYSYSCIAKDQNKHSKSHNGNVGIFNEEIRKKLLREKELENLMEKALAAEEYVVYLQPKYLVDGSKIGGAEALVRWISPEIGFISPKDFISVFEANGFIIQLDNYMLQHVCKLQRKWLDAGNEIVTVSVNISRIHMLDGELVNSLVSIVDKYEIPHKFIEFEITESAFFDGKETLLAVVNALREYGFMVSMDDFGSGFSSLNSLKDLPLDVVKLDCEFFTKSGDKLRSESVIKDTISLAKHLNMEIVAEGIETKEQVDLLKENGCDLIQGFYYAKPMPTEDFAELMKYNSTEEITEKVN
ncbi:MAG: bifunctional diguanylate cyclase/phosphodiesterase [Oscillospiraceae bacterium]